MSEPAHDPEITALEAALAGLKPLPDRIARDELMFRAGQASVPRRGKLWPGVALALGVLVAALGGTLLLRPPVVRLVVVRAPAAGDELYSPAPGDGSRTVADGGLTNDPAAYGRLRKWVLGTEADALPPAPAATDPAGDVPSRPFRSRPFSLSGDAL
jgi:hypothetical protein